LRKGGGKGFKIKKNKTEIEERKATFEGKQINKYPGEK